MQGGERERNWVCGACQSLDLVELEQPPRVPAPGDSRLKLQSELNATAYGVGKPKPVGNKTFYAGNKPPLPLVSVGTAAPSRQQQQQQRQQQAQQQQQARARRRQQQQQQQPKVVEGTADNPITLDSDDEAVAGPGKRRRTVRANASVGAAPLPAVQLQGLRCLMPPGGGPGAVEFTADDFARLAPEEFLNDTAIDFYLRHLQEALQQEDPAAAARCYFFNSFFYKKLSEKSGKWCLEN